jgi:hypothetical protein
MRTTRRRRLDAPALVNHTVWQLSECTVMSNAIHLEAAVTFIPAMGVDLLDGDLPNLGCSTVADLDDCAAGGDTMQGLADVAMSANSVAVSVTQTGAAGDDAALLVGASGADTLMASVSDVATGCNISLDHVDRTVGCDMLWSRDALPMVAVSSDLGVALILYRIERFSAVSPASISFRTGCAA